MKFILKPLLTVALLSGTAISNAESYLVTGNLTGDRYTTPHAYSGASAPTSPLFINVGDTTFNQFYSLLHMKWQFTLPPELVGKSIKVTSASIVLWQQKDVEQPWKPNGGQFKVFATGITGNNGFTTQTWTENQGYIGPNTGGVTTPQDPYPMELGTLNRAENNASATPWALGIVPSSYTGVTGPQESFPIPFQFDVNHPQIQNKLKTDLVNGYGMWTAGATFVANDPTAPPGAEHYYPRVSTKEGVGNTFYGTLQQAPRIVLEVEEIQSSVLDWNLY